MTDPPNFKFQIWPGHGEMTDPLPPFTKKFKFQIWPVHGEMMDPLKILNFGFGLDMDR